MKSKNKPKIKKPASDREALWPEDLLTDAHNDWVIDQLAKAQKNELAQLEADIDYQESLDHEQTISDARNAGCP